jgi:hypothetical protein
MAKKTARTYKVDYKGLVREIRKTLKALKKIESKVSAAQKDDIAEQIKSLSYLEGVCGAETPELLAMNPPPKMSGCKTVAAKMSRIYKTGE